MRQGEGLVEVGGYDARGFRELAPILPASTMRTSRSTSRERRNLLPHAGSTADIAPPAGSRRFDDALPAMRIARIGAVLQAREPIDLPPEAGPTLRGGFGRKLFARLCPRRRPTCGACDLVNDCAYGLLFETPATAIGKSPHHGGFHTPPHPFLIRWCADVSGPRPTGTRLPLELVLLDPARRFLSELKTAVRDLATGGLGRRLSKCEILGWTDLCSVGSDEAGETDLRFDPDVDAEREVEIDFFTPLRIHRRGRLVRRPTFADIAIAARRRVRNLAAFYGELEAEREPEPGAPPERDSFLDRAQQVESVGVTTQDVRFRRRSGRSGARQDFEGVAGRMRFRGPIEGFRPWLKLGERLGIGKGVSLGFGHYRVVPSPHAKRES